MHESRFGIARSLAEFLEPRGAACQLAPEGAGGLNVSAPQLARAQLLALVADFCRAHDAFPVQVRALGRAATRVVLAWADEAGEPRFLTLRFHGATQGLPPWPWARQPAIAFFGADESLRAGVIERVHAAIASALHGALRLRSCADASARRLAAPDLWIALDAPDAPARERDRALTEHLWNAAVVDASGGPEAAARDAVWALLLWLGGRLEFRHAELQAEPNPLLARLLLRWCGRRTPVLAKLLRALLNCDIYCRIWSPVLLAHPYGIVIHAGTVIGRRVTIMQQVTLGAKDRGVNAAPVLEDDVYVGAGAKVLGAVRVGRGAIIGANAVVTRDVPPYCTVVGANRIVRGEAAGAPAPQAAQLREAR
jgi:serine O-acetyltransferase